MSAITARLHRTGRSGCWAVQGADLTVFRGERGEWHVTWFGDHDSWTWLVKHGLSDAKFATRREAVACLSAAMALERPPARRTAQTRLVRVRAGLHRTGDGKWEVRKVPSGWEISRDGQRQHASTLRQAAQTIADEQPFAAGL